MDTFKISNSKLSTFWGCEQRFVYNYINKLVPKAVADPLRFGGAYHNGVATILHPTNQMMDREHRKTLALQTLERYCIENDMEEHFTTIGKWVLLYESNIQPFLDSHRILSVEQWNEVEVFTIEGIKIYAICKSDALAVHNATGLLWVVEHKTAASMGPAKEKQFTDSGQIAQYSYVLRELLRKPIYGVRYHFIIKTKTPRFYPCDGLIDDNKLKRWYDTAHASTIRMLQLMDGATPIQNLNSCNGPFQECKYKPICNFGLSNTAVQGLYKEKEEMKPGEGGILA